MAQQISKPANALDKVDPVWARMRGEAEDIVRREPEIATFIYSSVLHHDTLEAAVVHRVAERLDHRDVSAELIRQAYADALEAQPQIGEAFRADIVATFDRDPATDRFLEPVLYYKGFHAIQTHRLAHWLWSQGPQGLRLLPCRAGPRRCSSATSIRRPRSAAAFSSITPPAWWSARPRSIGNDVSILHDVTLGGTGKDHGDRHPKIADGVLIGAGAKIIGNIEIGHCARIAAGSVVIKPVPNNVTVAGVPAKIVGDAACEEPSRTMDHMFPHS